VAIEKTVVSSRWVRGVVVTSAWFLLEHELRCLFRDVKDKRPAFSILEVENNEMHSWPVDKRCQVDSVVSNINIDFYTVVWTKCGPMECPDCCPSVVVKQSKETGSIRGWRNWGWNLIELKGSRSNWFEIRITIAWTLFVTLTGIVVWLRRIF